MTLQNDFFFLIWGQLMRHPCTQLSHLSNLLQMLNDQRMVTAEFFGSFLRSCQKISFSEWSSQLFAATFWWPALCSLSLRLSSSLRNSLNHHCTEHSLAVPGPNALMLRVISIALWLILNSNKKNTQIAFA